MQAWGVSIATLEMAMNRVNKRYDANLCWKREPEHVGRAFAFTLTVTDSGKRGARRSRTGRRIAAACWHAHRDFMRGLFKLEPEARLKTMLSDYHGARDFEERFEATGEQNIGSVFAPMCLADACECEAMEVGT